MENSIDRKDDMMALTMREARKAVLSCFTNTERNLLFGYTRLVNDICLEIAQKQEERITNDMVEDVLLLSAEIDPKRHLLFDKFTHNSNQLFNGLFQKKTAIPLNWE